MNRASLAVEREVRTTYILVDKADRRPKTGRRAKQAERPAIVMEQAVKALNERITFLEREEAFLVDVVAMLTGPREGPGRSVVDECRMGRERELANVRAELRQARCELEYLQTHFDYLTF